MSVDTERSSTESSAASRLGYKDTTFALTLRLPGSDSGRSSSLAAPSDAAPSPKARVVGWPPAMHDILYHTYHIEMVTY
ncbi:hypothetical protein ZEAMMB73_Zm00001d025989 [Zea mays]|uniref:Auxin-responsive protein n=1 Tax=Zea mays TaxID=4577 RepID=A0A1D6JBJ2_MAIZE|nr:hypothetical protein ZEAMMB73_Zm00001d025989 [Zea mays]